MQKWFPRRKPTNFYEATRSRGTHPFQQSIAKAEAHKSKVLHFCKPQQQLPSILATASLALRSLVYSFLALFTMKLSALALLSFAALSGAQQVTVSAAASSIEDTAAEMQGDPSLKELGYHVFPGLYYFEVNNDVVDDSALLASVEEAFVQSANAVHDTNLVRFNGVRISDVVHQQVQNTKPDGTEYVPPTLSEESEEGIESASPEDWMEEDDLELSVANFMAEPGRMLSDVANGLTWHRKKKAGKKVDPRQLAEKKWRIQGNLKSSMGCNSCSPEEGGAMMTATGSVSPLTNGFYLTEAGSDMLIKWQHTFCNRLKLITQLQNPHRCFIRMDFDHEVSNQEAIALFEGN